MMHSCTSENKEYYPDGKLKRVYILSGNEYHNTYVEYFKSGAVKESH